MRQGIATINNVERLLDTASAMFEAEKPDELQQVLKRIEIIINCVGKKIIEVSKSDDTECCDLFEEEIDEEYEENLAYEQVLLYHEHARLLKRVKGLSKIIDIDSGEEEGTITLSTAKT